eukprot:GHVR01079694.1.p1 GENE.GHVR01079694.1~~GHVR01079694.1.p1  ORF type:complete len:388 (+),score=37.28 GHVR01079694.1:608-1771(+)
MFEELMNTIAINEKIPGAIYNAITNTFSYTQAAIDTFNGKPSPDNMTKEQLAEYYKTIVVSGPEITKKDFLETSYMLFFNGLYIPLMDDADVVNQLIREAMKIYHSIRQVKEVYARIGSFILMFLGHCMVIPSNKYPLQMKKLMTKLFPGLTDIDTYFPILANIKVLNRLNECSMVMRGIAFSITYMLTEAESDVARKANVAREANAILVLYRFYGFTEFLCVEAVYNSSGRAICFHPNLVSDLDVYINKKKLLLRLGALYPFSKVLSSNYDDIIQRLASSHYNKLARVSLEIMKAQNNHMTGYHSKAYNDGFEAKEYVVLYKVLSELEIVSVFTDPNTDRNALMLREIQTYHWSAKLLIDAINSKKELAKSTNRLSPNGDKIACRK